jgi:hypothetical protein
MNSTFSFVTPGANWGSKRCRVPVRGSRIYPFLVRVGIVNFHDVEKTDPCYPNIRKHVSDIRRTLPDDL